MGREDAADTRFLGKGNRDLVGDSSNNLIQAMDAIYGTKLGLRRLKQEMPFEAVSLEGNPERVLTNPVKLKLFFDSTNQATYAEIFLNIDVAKGAVQLNEKAPEYRRNVVRALGSPLR